MDAATPTMRVPMVVPVSADSPPPAGYHNRLATGWCTYGACPRRAVGWPDPTHGLCQRHLQKEQKRDAKRKRVQRAELVAAGKCRDCKRPSSTHRCTACRILQGKHLPSTRVPTMVPMHATRVSTLGGEVGRKRYHGKQSRGETTHAEKNKLDVRHAKESFDAFIYGILWLGSDEAKGYAAQDIQRVKDAVGSQAERCAGRVDDILERMGHFKERHGRRKGE